MLRIGSPMYKLILEKLDGKTIDGVSFETYKEDIIYGIVKTSDDKAAKKIVNRIIDEIPELESVARSVVEVDESGRLI